MSEPSAPCSSPDAGQFDFWLGEWDLTWPAEQTGGTPGDRGAGTNRIERRLGGCVVEENFATSDGKFLGKSVSVYDPEAAKWRQTWVDNTGGYLLFEGALADGSMELRTRVIERDGESIVQRMVFTEITEDSLTWHWQGSRDGGATWNELWTISYVRKG